MSDNITELKQLNMQEEPERHTVVKKIVILAAVTAAICGLVCLFLFHDGLNLDTFRRWGKYLVVRGSEEFGNYSFDSHSSNRYENFADGLIVASIGGLSVYDKSGEEVQVLQRQLELPRLIVNGDMAVAYDVSGTSLVALHKNRGEVLSLEESYPILDADLSEEGAICLSSSASGYKSVLSVYNQEQILIYRWLSSSTYFPLCAVSSDAKLLAAVAMGQEDGIYESSLYFFRTNEEEVKNKISLGNELIYDIFFLDDEIGVIGETGVRFFSTKGENLGEYEYQDKYLKDFDCGGEGFLTFATNMYRAGNRYSLVTVNERGRQMATRYIGSELLDVSACGRYIAALTPGKLTVYTPSLGIYCETTDVANATSVVMRKDGSVLMLGAGEGSLYIP